MGRKRLTTRRSLPLRRTINICTRSTRSDDFNGTKDGAVSAFAITPKTGALTFLNGSLPPAAPGPCFVGNRQSG